MQLLIGKCEVFYRGRGHTWLPPYHRIVMIKEDGSIAVHSDAKYQPLNYMPKTESITINESTIEAYGNNETLRIVFENGFQKMVFPLGTEDPGLVRSGTEAHLHQWLETNLTKLSENLLFITSEYDTGNGAVDILAKHIESGILTVIEVKRVATSTAITQVRRYVEAMEEQGIVCEPVIIALEFRPRTIELAKKHNIQLIEAPANYYL